MATGDLRNNLLKLKQLLDKIGYCRQVDWPSIARGDPSDHFSILSFLFQDFSASLTRHLVDKGLCLTGKSNVRSLDNYYSALVKEFNYRPSLTKDQFLTVGFAERKVMLLNDVISTVIAFETSLRSVGMHSIKTSVVQCLFEEDIDGESPSVPPLSVVVQRHDVQLPDRTGLDISFICTDQSGNPPPVTGIPFPAENSKHASVQTEDSAQSESDGVSALTAAMEKLETMHRDLLARVVLLESQYLLSTNHCCNGLSPCVTINCRNPKNLEQSPPLPCPTPAGGEFQGRPGPPIPGYSVQECRETNTTDPRPGSGCQVGERMARYLHETTQMIKKVSVTNLDFEKPSLFH